MLESTFSDKKGILKISKAQTIEKTSCLIRLQKINNFCSIWTPRKFSIYKTE